MAAAIVVGFFVVVFLAHDAWRLRKRLHRYEMVDGPAILEIPIDFRPCPVCGRPLWGGITVERMPLTGMPGLRFVTGIDPWRIRADGTPVIKQIQGVDAAAVDALYQQYAEIGWCPQCQDLEPATTR